MKRTAGSKFLEVVRLSRPLQILAGFLFYALGVGIVNYLGKQIDWITYFIGQGAVTMMQLCGFTLKAAFDLPELPRRNRQSNPDEGEILTRSGLMLLGLVWLAIGAALTVLLASRNSLSGVALLFLVAGYALAVLYGVPPLRIVYTGYGELLQAVMIGSLIPAVALLFQVGELHRLLLMLTIPLVFLYLAMLLALSLQNYSEDLKKLQNTLMIRIGWQRGMQMHNLLILLAYVILGFASLVGLPWSLTWPGLVSLPVAIFQIVQMIQIGNGTKPRWMLLNFTAIATVALATYFITLTLWVR